MRQLRDEVLGELLQLVSGQSAQRLRDGRPQTYRGRLSEETDGHTTGIGFRRGRTGFRGGERGSAAGEGGHTLRTESKYRITDVKRRERGGDEAGGAGVIHGNGVQYVDRGQAPEAVPRKCVRGGGISPFYLARLITDRKYVFGNTQRLSISNIEVTQIISGSGYFMVRGGQRRLHEIQTRHRRFTLTIPERR